MLKRFSALLVTLALLLSCARAVPDVPYAADTLLVYYQQPEAVRQVVDILYEGAAQHRESIAMPPGTKYADVDAAVLVLWDEFPELFHLTGDASISYFQSAPDYAIAVELTYVLTPDEYAAAWEALQREAKAVASGASGMAYDRELFVHDALAARTTYATDIEAHHSYTAYGALVEGSAVCEGYANAMTLLCRMAGIPCSTISGMATADGVTQLHAWNAVNIEGEIVQTDCTFNDTDDKTITVHWYFNLPARDMALSHQSDTTLKMSNSDAWSYMRRTGGYIKTTEAVQYVFDAQHALMRETGRPMELRAANATLYQQLLDSVRELMIYNGSSSWSVYSEDALHSLMITE